MPRFQQTLIEHVHHQSLSFGLKNGGLSELTSSHTSTKSTTKIIAETFSLEYSRITESRNIMDDTLYLYDFHYSLIIMLK